MELIELFIAFVFILRPTLNSKCYSVVREVLDWSDSDFEVSF